MPNPFLQPRCVAPTPHCPYGGQWHMLGHFQVQGAHWWGGGSGVPTALEWLYRFRHQSTISYIGASGVPGYITQDQT